MHSLKVANTISYITRKKIYRPPLPHEICSPCGSHLGDCWSFVSCVLKYKIKTIAVDGGIEKKIREIIPLLDSKHRPEIIDTHPNRRTVHSFGHKYLETKTKWSDGYYDRICYQFDGKSSAKVKNLPKEREVEIINTIEGISAPFKLGKELSLLECVRAAATSDLFIGVESGMSHLCHSVGIPIIIIPSRLGDGHTEKYHGGNEYELLNNFSIIRARIREISNTKRIMAQNGAIEDKRLISGQLMVYNHPPSLRQEPSHKHRYRVVANI